MEGSDNLSSMLHVLQSYDSNLEALTLLVSFQGYVGIYEH